MIELILSLIPGGGVVAGAIAALLAALGVYAKGRSDGKAKNATDTLERGEKGRQGATKAKDDLAKGKTPDQIVRDNDEKWN